MQATCRNDVTRWRQPCGINCDASHLLVFGMWSVTLAGEADSGEDARQRWRESVVTLPSPPGLARSACVQSRAHATINFVHVSVLIPILRRLGLADVARLSHGPELLGTHPLDTESVERPHHGNLRRPPHGEPGGLALDPPRDDQTGHRRSVAAGMLNPNVAHPWCLGRVDLMGVVAEPATHGRLSNASSSRSSKSFQTRAPCGRQRWSPCRHSTHDAGVGRSLRRHLPRRNVLLRPGCSWVAGPTRSDRPR